MIFFSVAILLVTLLAGCDKDYVPKPQGYFRIALPEKSYKVYEASCPLSFEMPAYAKIELFRNHLSSDSCWFNIYFPAMNARLHCTYMPVGNNFDNIMQDTYGFAAKHEVKATALKRTMIDDPERKVYGIIYDIEGEAASQLQFFVTDSAFHFFRGSLYFFNAPNPDSIAPVLSFIREDVVNLTNTITWR